MSDNNELYTNIIEKLRFEPGLDDSQVAVSTKDGGIVILGGKVKSYAEKHLAEEAVKKLANVKGIANELVVDLALSYKRSDVDILKAAMSALKWSMFIPHDQIKVTVESGHLTLSGEVEYNYQKERAAKALRNLYGTTGITNNIKVKPSVTPFEVKAQIIKEFERNARIDASNIKVEVDGGTVTLKGSVKNLDEDEEAENAAWSVPGVSNIINDMFIE